MPVFKFLGNFLKKIGEFFSSLTKGAEKVWNNLEPEIQIAMQDASGIIDKINQYLDKDSDFILSALQAAFPQFPLDHIEMILKAVATDLNMGENIANQDIKITLQNIVNYLKSRTGSRWAKASEDMASLIAIILAPANTPWNKIGTIMWWVYQTFIKKS